MQAVNQVDKYGDFAGNFGQSANNQYSGGPSAYPSESYGQQQVDYGQQAPPSAVRSVQAPQTLSPDHYVQPASQVPKCSACQTGIV